MQGAWKHLSLIYLARNLTVKVNTQEGLEVLICDLPHSKGLLGHVGQEAQEDEDGVLGWDGEQVNVTGMTQSKGFKNIRDLNQQVTSCSLIPVFAVQGGWKSFAPRN